MELWLSHDKVEEKEPKLGLDWCCDIDNLGFKNRPVTYSVPTMKNRYHVFATQYDPLGVILPFTTQAKVIIQQLWDKHRDWDDPMLPEHLLQAC